MLQIKTILFPTDFSECAEHAFAQAADLATKYDATVHVLNIEVLHVHDPDNPMAFLQDLDLDAFKKEAVPGDAEHGGRVIYDRRLDFSEATGILQYANEHDIDLIIMGTHGRRGLGRLLLGSVAEEVVRLASCPVITVGSSEDEEQKRPIRRILAPVDFSTSSRAALTYAKELAAAYGAHLDVLHVIRDVKLPGVYGIAPVAVATQEVKARVRKGLRTAVEESPGAEVPFEGHVLAGFPAPEIIDFAALQQADLVVLATHGHTGLKRLVMGSVAENVIRLAPCPVFTLKSFGKSLIGEEGTGMKILAAPLADDPSAAAANQG